MAETGRGAWTSIGKDNGSTYYSFFRNRPLDGSTPEASTSHEAVRFGVVAIQERLVSLGYDRWLKVNDYTPGSFDRKTRRMVKFFQGDLGITTSGQVGPTTGSALFGTYIKEVGQAFNFDHSYIYGIMKQESGGDPGAVGWFTPGDRGLFQFNTVVHTDISWADAHDYVFATDAVFSRFNNAWKRYQGKGEELRTDCSIAQHNAPAWADQWFEDGVAPNDTIKGYVGKIKAFALSAP